MEAWNEKNKKNRLELELKNNKNDNIANIESSKINTKYPKTQK